MRPIVGITDSARQFLSASNAGEKYKVLFRLDFEHKLMARAVLSQRYPTLSAHRRI
jgi:hypothetical protein